MYSLGDIAQIVDAELIGDPNLSIDQLLYDSRKTSTSPHGLFVAIHTEAGDGHRYVQQVMDHEVGALMVEKQIHPSYNQLIVKNSLLALQKLAAHHRQQFAIPLIGVTGSNGKTIVKEWLSFLLAKRYKIHKSPKSFNSQLGVALSLWPLNKQHQLAIIEAGISQAGEMSKLEAMIKPTLGVFTHLGDAHGVNFESSAHKLNEKLLLFKSAEVVVCEHQDHIVSALAQKGIATYSWGNHPKADIQLHKVERKGHTSVLHIRYRNTEREMTIPFTDDASISNAMNCIATALFMGMDEQLISEEVQLLPAINMRLEQREGINGNSLILDYYNADLASMKIALEFLAQQSEAGQRMLILSDISESKYAGDRLYSELAKLIEAFQIDQLIGIGPSLKAHSELFTADAKFFGSTEEFMGVFPLYTLQAKTILLKGGRSFRFERIAELLSQKVHETVLEVNLSRLQNNLRVHRNALPRDTKIMAMVKAYGYGSGGHQLAKWLENNQIDYLGLAYIDEAVSLRKAGIASPIMVLNADLYKWQTMIDYQLEPVIYSMNSLVQLANCPLNQFIRIHLEFDTGMHRLGFETNEIQDVLDVLQSNQQLVIASVYSHLAVADDPTQDPFTEQQIDRFQRICKALRENLSYSFMAHLGNTAGIQRFPEASFDMVRLGIGLYGVGGHAKYADQLQAVGCFKSYITQIRTVAKGEGIGYGQHDAADHDRKIAVVAVGYADGFNRAYSRGKGAFNINGHTAEVVGNVCMDMTMCDVTNVPCIEGDEVIIFGDKPRVEELAKTIETIPYEVLTSVSERVNRVYYQEQ